MSDLPVSLLAFLQRCGIAEDTTRLPRLDQLQQLYQCLTTANQQVNLTRITDSNDFWFKHIADSLSLGIICPEVFSHAWEFADIGCGAGFPLLPLAWANPQLTAVGIESKHKKAEFITAAATEMGLTNVRVIAQQAREATRSCQLGGRFDLVTARAVTTTARLIRECRALLKRPNGILVVYKTPGSAAAEQAEAEREAAKHNLTVTLSTPLDLPAGLGARQFVIVGADVAA